MVPVWLPITVTDGRFALFSRTGRGFGPAAAVQYDPTGAASVNGLAAPAAVGNTIALFGTGLGALPSGSEADAPQAATLRTDVTIYIAGIAVTPSYAGRAPGLPGADQINFTLPAAVAPRCFVPLQIQTGSEFSNPMTLSVSSDAVCGNDLALTPSLLARLDAGSKLQGARLYFTSTTYSPAGSVIQTAKTFGGAWDESDLSLFIMPGTPLPPPICFRSDQAIATVAILGSPGPTPNITGTSGCQWQIGNPGCTAAGFAFGPEAGGVTGTLPPPPPASEIASLTASDTGQPLTASWSATPAPADTVLLAASSTYTNPGLPGASEPQTYNNTLSCQVPAAGPFSFPAADAAWAFQYAAQSVSLTITHTTSRAFPLTGSSYDFLMVNTVNSVNAAFFGPF